MHARRDLPGKRGQASLNVEGLQNVRSINADCGCVGLSKNIDEAKKLTWVECSLTEFSELIAQS